MEAEINPIVVLATGNPGKAAEFRDMFAEASLTLLRQDELDTPPEDVEETADSFEANAFIKAQAVAAVTNHPVLADDSGLEVDALDGAPGVRTARYAGHSATNEDNRAKLLTELGSRSNRDARFVCVLCFLAPGEQPRFFKGLCEGSIASSESGKAGFGYDPLFLPKDHTRTFAEMSHAEKAQLSHRGKAVADFLVFWEDWGKRRQQIQE